MHVPTKPMLAGSEAMSGRHCDGEIGEIMYLRSLCFYAEHCLYAQAHTHTPFSAHARMCSCLCARVRVSVLVRVCSVHTLLSICTPPNTHMQANASKQAYSQRAHPYAPHTAAMPMQSDGGRAFYTGLKG